MKLRLLAMAMLSPLFACGAQTDNSPLLINPVILSQADVAKVAVEIDSKPYLTRSYEGLISAICGPSDGISFYATDIPKSFSADSLREGRIVFIKLEPGVYDVVYRDNSGVYTSVLDDGGTVHREENGGLGGWVITYPKTGATETHNLLAVDGKLINLWTSNIPFGLSGPRVSSFVSSCVAL